MTLHLLNSWNQFNILSDQRHFHFDEVFSSIHDKKRFRFLSQFSSSFTLTYLILGNLFAENPFNLRWEVRLSLTTKEDLHRNLGIFILPIVSDWTNVFIVTWLPYAEEELTNSLLIGWQNVSRQEVRLYLLSYTDNAQSYSLN